MIDTNGLNAALTALIRPIVQEIVEREFVNFEYIKSRVSEAHQTLDAHRKLLANLETAIETLGKRVTENMLEADRQLDIHRREIDTAFCGVGKRIDYGENRLNEARGAISLLQEELVDLSRVVTAIQTSDSAPPPPPLDINDHIDKRLIQILSGDEGGDYNVWNKLKEFVNAIVEFALPDEYDINENIDKRLIEIKEERIRRVVRDVLSHEVTIDINVN